MNGKVLAVCFLIYIGYVALGGVLFYYIEVGFGKTRLSFEEPLNETLEEEIKECGLEAKLEHLSGLCNETNGRQELIEFIERVENCTKDGPLFDLATAVYFAGTISTTIGYGHVTPSTFGGKIFTIVFGIFGIPFCLVILGALGEKLRQQLTKLCGLLRLQKKTWSDKRNSTVLSLFIFILGAILFIIIPAAIFMVLEKWSYLDSIYFSFVTLSTVGFGDYVATTQHTGITRGLYMLCVGLWTYIGLAWLATCFTSFVDTYTKMVQRASPKDAPPSFSAIMMDGNRVNSGTQTEDFTVTVVTSNGIMRYQNAQLNNNAAHHGLHPHPPRYSELINDDSSYSVFSSETGSVIEISAL